MNSRFENLDPEKQQHILNAALKEFADKGYEQASTNNIVKEANIGKGMLFYYFENKKGLFLYLVDYALRKADEEFLGLADRNEPDFIERIKKFAKVKVDFYDSYPHISNFISTVYLHERSELPEHLIAKLEQFSQKSNQIIYSDVDQSLFRDDVDVEKAYQLIRWSLEGYQNELLRKLGDQHFASIDLTPYWDEFYEYIEILKKVYYKPKEEEQ